MAELVFETAHELYYSNKNHIAIPEIIKALNGLDGAVKHLPSVISKVYGVSIESSSVFISKIETGSLWQKFVIALNFSNEEEMYKAINKFGKDHPVIKNIINILFIAIVLFGLIEAVKRSGGDSSSLQANNNVIINIGAGEVGLTPDGLKAVIETAITDKKGLAKASINLVAPAKSDPEAFMRFSNEGGAASFDLSPQSIAEAPTQVKEETEFREAHFENAKIDVRALDLDKRTSGWFGIIDGINKRIPISLYPNVDTALIHNIIYADIILMYARQDSATDFVPYKIVIKKIGDPQKPAGLIDPQASIADVKAKNLPQAMRQVQLPLEHPPSQSD